MRNNALRLVVALAGCYASAVYADATLVYELVGPDAAKTEKTFFVARFWVRVDDPAEKDQYLLFQAGKFFPMYRVEPTAETYTRLTPEVKPTLHAGTTKKAEANDQQMPQGQVSPAPETNGDKEPDKGADQPEQQEEPARQPADIPEQAKTEAPGATVEPPKTPPQSTSADKAKPRAAQSAAKARVHPKFKPTKKTGTVAGVKCRVILELGEGKPVKEHCMANTGHLGLTDREVITVARLFAAAREMGFGWLGVGTKDERFVSIQSRDLTSDKTLKLTSVSTKPLPKGHLRVPKSFNEVKPKK